MALNRSFYPTASAVHPMSVLIHPAVREIQFLWPQIAVRRDRKKQKTKIANESRYVGTSIAGTKAQQRQPRKKNYENYLKKGQWPKTGAPGRFLARNGWAEVRRQQTLNLGSRDWPTPPSTCFWPYTDRDLPILATLVSSYPLLATFCCILLLLTSLFDLTSLA